jgi:hypothetical protein
MRVQKFHLAQINIGKAKSTMDSETMRGFVDRLDEINQLADTSPGFVWRLKDGDNAVSLSVYEDPAIIVNMSVWEDLETLKNYVYRSVHIELLKERSSWFNKMAEAHHTLWWIPASHTPSIDEGKERLKHFQDKGATEFAFNFVKSFPAPT